MEGKEGTTSDWMPYVQVDDLAHYTQKATQLGAHIVVPITQIMTGGSFSIIQDQSGACVGLYQPPLENVMP